MKPVYIPITPGGTPLLHLGAYTEDKAWENLMIEAAHMPYESKEAFIRRGYEVWEMQE